MFRQLVDVSILNHQQSYLIASNLDLFFIFFCKQYFFDFDKGQLISNEILVSSNLPKSQPNF